MPTPKPAKGGRSFNPGGFSPGQKGAPKLPGNKASGKGGVTRKPAQKRARSVRKIGTR